MTDVMEYDEQVIDTIRERLSLVDDEDGLFIVYRRKDGQLAEVCGADILDIFPVPDDPKTRAIIMAFAMNVAAELVPVLERDETIEWLE